MTSMERVNGYRESDGCYDNMALVKVVAEIPGERAICKKVKYLGIENHNGLTIVPKEFLRLAA